MGLFDWIGDIFGGGDEKKELPGPRRLPEEPWQTDLRREIQRYATGGTPFRGQASTLLEEYMGDVGLPGMARTELERTFGDYYEPYIGKAYEPFRKTAMRELEEAKTRQRRSAQMQGMLPSTPSLLYESRLEEGTLSNLMRELSRLHEGERARKAAAVPMAEQWLPRKIGAAQEFEEAPLRYAMNLLTGYKPESYWPRYADTGPTGGETLTGLLGSYMAGGGPLDIWNIGRGGATDLSGIGRIGAEAGVGRGYGTKGGFGGFMEEIEPILEIARLAATLAV